MKIILGLVILLVLSTFSFAQIKSESILGNWKSANGLAIVTIVKEGDKFNGRITWLGEPTYSDGTQKIDKYNPNENEQTKPLIGLTVFKDFRWNNNRWEGGKIYDAESGETYKCIVRMPDNETIRARGYIGISLIGRTDVWKRVK